MSHIIIRADKGLWTLEEILELLKKNKIKYKLVDKTQSLKTTKQLLDTGNTKERRTN